MISRNHSGVYPCVSRDRKRRAETETRGAVLIILTARSKKCDCSILQGEMGRSVRTSRSDWPARTLRPFIEIENVPRLGHNEPFYDSLCWHWIPLPKSANFVISAGQTAKPFFSLIITAYYWVAVKEKAERGWRERDIRMERVGQTWMCLQQHM